MEIELEIRAIPFLTKAQLPVFYKGTQLKTIYFPDLYVFGGIVIEIKAVSELVSDHQAQLFNYMRATRKQVGYLINFGRKKELEWKRLILTDLHAVPKTHHG